MPLPKANFQANGRGNIQDEDHDEREAFIDSSALKDGNKLEPEEDVFTRFKKMREKEKKRVSFEIWKV